MAKTVAFSFPSLETLFGEGFGKLLEAMGKFRNAQLWLGEFESSIKALAEKFGEKPVKPLVNFALTEFERVLRGERKFELAMFELLSLTKLAAVAEEFELLESDARKGSVAPKVIFRLADSECAAEWCDYFADEVFATLLSKFTLMRWRVNLIFIPDLAEPKIGGNLLPLLYGRDFAAPSPFNPFEDDFVIPLPDELGSESLFAKPKWKLVSGTVWLSHYFTNQTVKLSGFVLPNPNALRRIPLEVAVKLHESLNLKTFPCDAAERRATAEWLVPRLLKRLKEKWGVKRAQIWGSLKDSIFWHRRSDIDIVVEGLDWRQLVEAEEDLVAISPFVIPIQLTDWTNLPETVQCELGRGESIMSDWREKVRQELERIKEIMEEKFPEWRGRGDPAQDTLVRAGLGLILHDFYNGVERIFNYIVAALDEEVPIGGDWHRKLLEQVSKPTEKRPEVISQGLCTMLSEYLRFRHLLRHIYAVTDLKWERMCSLVKQLPQVYEQVRREIETFIARFNDDANSVVCKQ